VNPKDSAGNKKNRIAFDAVFSCEQCCSHDAGVLAASTAFFDFLGFFGRFLCSSMGGEYDDALLSLAPVPGFGRLVCAKAAGLADANNTAAATARAGVSLFMFDFLRDDGWTAWMVRERHDDDHSHDQV